LPPVTILAGTLLAPLAGAAPALVPLLFGERWSPAVNALSLACLAVVIHRPVMVAGQSYLWTSGDAKSPLHAMIVDAIICVGLGLPLVPILGVLGLAVAGVAAATVHAAIVARAVDRQIHVRVLHQIRGPVLAWMAAAGVAWACAQGPGPLVLRAAVSSCLALGLYFGLLFLIRRELMLELARGVYSSIRRHLLRRGPAPAQVTTSAQA
jgi:O-antigen/teichoic acid export membrane protein